jgi:hypothetical protein
MGRLHFGIACSSQVEVSKEAVKILPHIRLDERQFQNEGVEGI